MFKLGCLAIILALVAMCSAGGYLVPGQKIIGYWGCQPGGHRTTIPQLQTSLDKGYNVIIFAFYLVDENGAITVDPGSVAPPTKAAIGSKPFSYLISLFGGQNGAAPPLTLSADAWALNMFNNFVQLHQTYGYDGIDIDLENSWGTTENKVACGLRTFFKLMHNAGFVVSMAPQTTAVWSADIPYIKSSWNSYVPLLDSSIIDYVDIVAIQLYNNPVPMDDASKYTDSLTQGFQVSGCPVCEGQAAGVTGLVKIPACKLAHGWPSTLGAAPAGCSTPRAGCPYGSTLTSLYAASASLTRTAGVMTWAIEWDEVGGWAFINAATAITYTATSCSGSNTPVVLPTIAPPAPTVAPTKAPTVAPATVAPTQPPTAAPATAAPATAAPATAAPATAAPATAAPATAAPVPATSAPTRPPPPALATTKPGSGPSCNIQISQTPTSSWQAAGGVTVTQYSVSFTGSADLKNLRFKMSGVTSQWGLIRDESTSTFQFQQWYYNGDGVIPAGTASQPFGYISESPAVITVVGNPCQ